jgi:aconitate decarboxylase
LGHASSMSAGSRNVFATDTLIVHPGLAARNGILAARFAKHGLSSTSHALEKWVNLMSTQGEESYPQRIVDLLKQTDEHEKDFSGRDWTLRANAFKPYPCGIVIHTLIDAGIEAHKVLFRATQRDAKNVLHITSKIEARVSPMTIRLCGIRHPQELVETLFSNYHGLAVGVIFGAGGIREFSKEVADESAVTGLRDRIELIPDETFRDNQAVVKFWYMTDGKEEVLEVPIDYATGSLENPMSVSQLNEKFESQGIEGKLSKTNITSAIEKLWNLEHATDIRSLMDLLRP